MQIATVLSDVADRSIEIHVLICQTIFEKTNVNNKMAYCYHSYCSDSAKRTSTTMVFKKRALNTVCKIARYAVHVQTSGTSTCGWVCFPLLESLKTGWISGGGDLTTKTNKQTINNTIRSSLAKLLCCTALAGISSEDRGRSRSEPLMLTQMKSWKIKTFFSFFNREKKINSWLIHEDGIDRLFCKAGGEVERKCWSSIVEPYPVRQRVAMKMIFLWLLMTSVKLKKKSHHEEYWKGKTVLLGAKGVREWVSVSPACIFCVLHRNSKW